MIQKSLLLSKGSGSSASLKQTEPPLMVLWMDSYTADSLQLYFVFYNKHAWSYGKERLPPRQKLPDTEERIQGLTWAQSGLYQRTAFPAMEGFRSQTVFYPSTCTPKLSFSEGSMPCHTGLHNHFSTQVALPWPLVALTHHLRFGAPCWRCYHLKMSPCKYQQNHPIYL